MKIKRSQIIVNTKLQLALLLYSIGLVSGVLLVRYGLTLFFQSYIQASSIVQLFTFVMVCVALIFFLVIFLGLYLTNRIAGPIYKLTTHMEKIAAGEVPEPIRFRKNDYFKEIIIPYNKILTRLEAAEQNSVSPKPSQN